MMSSDHLDWVMIQIQWWCPVMIQIEWWSKSSDDDQWWSKSSDDVPWWSRSKDDIDSKIDDDLKMKMTWRLRRLEIQMMRWSSWCREEDQWWKLCRENTFLVKRECWCNYNFGMYSLVFLIYCNLMFIPGFIVMYLSHVRCWCLFREVSIMRNSCQVIVGNPPIGQRRKSPHKWWGTRVIRHS